MNGPNCVIRNLELLIKDPDRMLSLWRTRNAYKGVIDATDSTQTSLFVCGEDGCGLPCRYVAIVDENEEETDVYIMPRTIEDVEIRSLSESELGLICDAAVKYARKY